MTSRKTPSRPVGIVNTSHRLRHEIRFFDQATPSPPFSTARAKPAPHSAPTQSSVLSPFTFVFFDTASPYTAEFEGTDAGKTAYYILRWVTTRGEKGPWSETVAATISG